jgi:XRE family transcriptional regulator, regulator of sulfur utilization
MIEVARPLTKVAAMASPPLDQLTVQIARSIRAHRQARGLTVAALASKAGLSKSSLATIETGLGNPSVETLWRLASAMDVTLGAILDHEEPPPTRIIRARDAMEIEYEGGMSARLILGEGRNHRTEVYEATAPAGADHRSEPHTAGTEELVICQEGRIVTGSRLNEVELERGDALWFPADLPHRYHAVEDSRMVIVMSFPPAQGIAR